MRPAVPAAKRIIISIDGFCGISELYGAPDELGAT